MWLYNFFAHSLDSYLFILACEPAMIFFSVVFNNHRGLFKAATAPRAGLLISLFYLVQTAQ